MKEDNILPVINKLRLIFWAMFFGSGIFLVIMVYMIGNKKMIPQTDIGETGLYAIVGLSIILTVGSKILYGRKLKEIKKINEPEKQDAYFKANVVSLAMTEAAIILTTTCFLLTGVKDYSYLGLALLLLLRLQKPSMNKANKELFNQKIP